MARIAVLGRVVWDEWQDAGNLADTTHFGGPGGNIASHLARLGHRITFATAFGSDKASDLYRAHLVELGVDLSHSVIREGDLPRCRLWIHQPCWEWVNGWEGYDALRALDLDACIADADAAVFADVPLAGKSVLGTLPRRTYTIPQWTIERGFTSLPDLGRLHCRAAFLNQSEAEYIAQGASFRVALSNLARTCVVTGGPGPIQVIENGGIWEKTPPPSGVVNPIGGGDALAAGTIAALEAGKSLDTALELGISAASIVIGKIGCQAEEIATLSYRL